MKVRPFLIAAFVLVVSLFTGCTDKEEEVARRVAGVYRFDYKDGRVEIWIVQNDFKFEQKFYQSDEAFKANTPLLKYGNRWTLKSDRPRPRIEFERCYMIMDYGTGKPMVTPEMATGVVAGWEAGDVKYRPYLDFLADDGYVAVRIAP